MGFLGDLMRHIFGSGTPDAGSADASLKAAGEAGAKGDSLEERDHEYDALKHLDEPPQEESSEPGSGSNEESGHDPGAGSHSQGSSGDRDYAGGSDHGSGGSDPGSAGYDPGSGGNYNGSGSDTSSSMG